MKPSPAPSDNPYVGPHPLETGQKIYGRDREILELSDLLVYKRFVLLHSPSGAGKTSLIQAGLIPLLTERRFRVTQPPIRVNKEPPLDFIQAGLPYNRYLLSAYISMEEEFPEQQRTALAELAGLRLEDYMALRQKKLVALDPESARRVEVLIFDQFEEIISLDPTDQDAKREFFNQLGELLYEYRHLALFAMREDYAAGLGDYLLPLPERLGVRFRIDLLGLTPAKDAIQRPARSRGVDFLDPAAEKLIEDLCQINVQQADSSIKPIPGPFVEPVLLQVVSQRLWEIRQNEDAIGLDDLDSLRSDLTSMSDHSELETSAEMKALSNVDLALAAYYMTNVTRVAEAMKAEEVTERAIRDWFDQQLITSQGLRGQVLKTPVSSQGLNNKAIQALLDAYLVRKEDRRGLTWFELAHDRLVRPIQANNRAWYAKNLQAFQHKAALWLSQGKSPTLLLGGRELQEAEGWEGDLTPGEQEYLQKSVEARRTFERERHAERGTNLADTGWGVIFAAEATPAIREALVELLEHRRQQATGRRLEFYKEFAGSRGYQRGETTRQFLARHGAGFGPANPDKMPYYLLIVGGPESIPFEFQYSLDERFAVGRIDFESLEEYASYARSVVESESGKFALSKRLAIFNPQPPGDRSSELVAQYLARPMHEQFQQAFPDWQAQYLAAGDATKATLAQVLGGPQTPALFFSAAHGMLFQEDVQNILFNGALVCQDWPGPKGWSGAIPGEFYFAAADIPDDARLLGTVAFLFGEYTAGTPQQEDFAYMRQREPRQLAARPFLARLPQRLLGHPQGGALAVIGHVDVNWAYSFMGEGNQPDTSAIFDTVDRLLRGHTVGSAMEPLNQRYNNFYNLMAEELFQLTFRSKERDDRLLQRMLTQTNDARNYILIGDPGARLPVETGPVVIERPAIEPVALMSVPVTGPPPVGVASPPAPEENTPLAVPGGAMEMGSEAAPASKGLEFQPLSTNLWIFNGINALTGKPLLSIPLEEFAALIQQELPDRELERELRWFLDARSSQSAY